MLDEPNRPHKLEMGAAGYRPQTYRFYCSRNRERSLDSNMSSKNLSALTCLLENLSLSKNISFYTRSSSKYRLQLPMTWNESILRNWKFKFIQSAVLIRQLYPFLPYSGNATIDFNGGVRLNGEWAPEVIINLEFEF